MVFNQDFKEFLQSLNDNQVRYLVVGGYAATLHGYPRRAKNLDIWIEASPQNARYMVTALEQLSLKSLQYKENDFSIEDQIIQVEFAPIRRIIINTINAIEFGACFENRAQNQIDDITVDIIALENLRINKTNLWKATGFGRA